MIVGYSEVLQVMAAMVLFSLILMTSNKVRLLNTEHEIESQAEKIAVSLAQSIIDEARVKPFDAESTSGPPSEIPEGFSTCGPSPNEEDEGKSSFNDFDDYDTYTNTVNTSLGDNTFTIKVGVRFVKAPDFNFANGSTSDKTRYKKMQVTVTSDFLTESDGTPIEITLPYLRKYYRQ